MKWSIYLTQVRGIKIFLHWSFLILVIWIAFGAWGKHHGLDDALYAGGYILLLFGCVALHELGHALTARRFGIRTQDITLLPFGGVARMENMPEKPGEEFLVAIAGPAVNVVIAGFLLGLHYILAIPIRLQPDLSALNETNLLSQLMIVNVAMAVFNLIPAFPMDGGRILRAAFSLRFSRIKATQIAARIGQVFAVAFVVLGIFGNFWLVFIGIFVYLGAGGEAEQEYVKSELSHFRVKDLVMTDFPTIKNTDLLGKAIRASLMSQSKEFIVVDALGQVQGTLTPIEMLAGLSKSGENTPIHQVMRTDLPFLSPEISIVEGLRQMTENNAQMLPVGTADRIIGIIDMANITEFLQVRKAIQK